MALFGNLFQDDEDMGQSCAEDLVTDTKISVPRSPRGSHGLCGIYNQGATCYLNSLLQTLFLTSELRGNFKS